MSAIATTSDDCQQALQHYENFPVASLLLPRPLRAAVKVLYRFARSADDIADEGNLPAAERLRQLDNYAEQLSLIEAGCPSRQPLFQQLAIVVQQHHLSCSLLHDLLDAFRQDVLQQRYTSHIELRDYCRRSANPVGRLLLQLFNSTTPRHFAPHHFEWSDAICTSLQLINHWQDVAIDMAKQPSRLYLPRQELERHGVSEAQIAAGICDDRWRTLMRDEVDRARTLMLSGAPLGRALPGRIGLELRLIIQGGLRILEKIEAVDYDIFRRRPTVQRHDLPVLLWRALTMRANDVA
ncbi:MAG: squalene synthase HpnC [Sterolibacterium sp.]|nr:squalene synthase HpnC [Sterolibacterium sp.]MBP9799794.1 squalene synthase HpnC [Sterolibacterium sp.]